MTTNSAEDKSDYVERGREHADLSSDQLQAVFVSIFQELTRCGSYDLVLTKLHDVEAEYKLRKLETPYGLVRDEAERFIRMISDAVNKLDAEQNPT